MHLHIFVAATARIARPLDTIPDSKLDHLKLALNVIHVKVLASDVGFPISVYGTVLMRDDLDFKSIYLFQRGRDNCQVINSPVGTDPSNQATRRQVIHLVYTHTSDIFL